MLRMDDYILCQPPADMCLCMCVSQMCNLPCVYACGPSLDAPRVIRITTSGYLDNGDTFFEKATPPASPSKMLTSPSLHLQTESSRQAPCKLTTSSMGFTASSLQAH